MYLTPHEVEKMTLYNAGVLAQRRLARGVKLNYPESVALIATVTLELIRDGKHSVAQLMELGRTYLGRKQVMPGIPEIVSEVQVEGTFPDGTKLVSLHNPITNENGDLKLALHGSFLPVPDLSLFDSTSEKITPGAYTPATEELTINADRQAIGLTVTNTGDRPIQVGSHYHFIETNHPLKFDRAKAYGKRLDIAAGTAIRFEPGETKKVFLVDIDGNKIIRGGNNLAGGHVDDVNKSKALEQVKSRNYLNQPE
jgi:urease beta subunit/urease gamma subunit